MFADYVVAKIFTLNYDGSSVSATNFQNVTAQLFPTSLGGFGLGTPSSVGEDANGELYITDIGSGSVFKIVPTSPLVELVNTQTLANGHVLITAFGVPFQVHKVQATTDLIQAFTEIATVNAGGDGSFTFEDPIAAGFPARFYRVVFDANPIPTPTPTPTPTTTPTPTPTPLRTPTPTLRPTPTIPSRPNGGL